MDQAGRCCEIVWRTASEAELMMNMSMSKHVIKFLEHLRRRAAELMRNMGMSKHVIKF